MLMSSQARSSRPTARERIAAVGAEFRSVRIGMQLERWQIAEGLGIHVDTVRNYEEGRERPSAAVMERLRLMRIDRRRGVRHE